MDTGTGGGRSAESILKLCRLGEQGMDTSHRSYHSALLWRPMRVNAEFDGRLTCSGDRFQLQTLYKYTRAALSRRLGQAVQ